MLLVKPNLNVLPKATAVVIPRCLGIPKSLEETHNRLSVTCVILSFCLILLHCPYYLHDRVGGQDSLLNTGLTGGAADFGKVTHSILSRDGFASSRLTTHNDGLVSFISVSKGEMTCRPNISLQHSEYHQK